MTIHISWTRFTITKMPVVYCWTCEKRRRALLQFQEWYGWTGTCLTCGEMWQDGEMLERPFRPRWRKDNIAAAWNAWHSRTVVFRA